MNVDQQMLHLLTGNIYLHQGEEILPDSQEWQEFQAAADPTVLGYVLVEAASERELRLAEALKNQDPHNP